MVSFCLAYFIILVNLGHLLLQNRTCKFLSRCSFWRELNSHEEDQSSSEDEGMGGHSKMSHQARTKGNGGVTAVSCDGGLGFLQGPIRSALSCETLCVVGTVQGHILPPSCLENYVDCWSSSCFLRILVGSDIGCSNPQGTARHYIPGTLLWQAFVSLPSSLYICRLCTPAVPSCLVLLVWGERALGNEMPHHQLHDAMLPEMHVLVYLGVNVKEAVRHTCSAFLW